MNYDLGRQVFKFLQEAQLIQGITDIIRKSSPADAGSFLGQLSKNLPGMPYNDEKLRNYTLNRES